MRGLLEENPIMKNCGATLERGNSQTLGRQRAFSQLINSHLQNNEKFQIIFLTSRLDEKLDLASLFEINLPLRQLFMYEPIKKDPELFDSTPSRIPIFQTNTLNICRVEFIKCLTKVFFSLPTLESLVDLRAYKPDTLVGPPV